MDARRIAELLELFLEAQTPRPNIQDLLPSISTYIDLLIRWNARINLTAIRDPEQIITRHFGDSLFAARHLFPDRAAERRKSAVHPEGSRMDASRAAVEDRDQVPQGRKKLSLADVGSGPGFPGLPIKLWAPDISLTLIESNHKKATFLRRVAHPLVLLRSPRLRVPHPCVLCKGGYHGRVSLE